MFVFLCIAQSYGLQNECAYSFSFGKAKEMIHKIKERKTTTHLSSDRLFITEAEFLGIIQR